jgi:hypothetical protein
MTTSLRRSLLAAVLALAVGAGAAPLPYDEAADVESRSTSAASSETSTSARYGNPIKKGIPAAVVVSPAGQIVYATRAAELADARSMSESGVYDFFRGVPDSVGAKR